MSLEFLASLLCAPASSSIHPDLVFLDCSLVDTIKLSGETLFCCIVEAEKELARIKEQIDFGSIAGCGHVIALQ